MSPQEQEQERLYHLKNAVYLSVHQKASVERNSAAYQAFLTFHTELQERVRTNRDLNDEDISSLSALAVSIPYWEV